MENKSEAQIIEAMGELLKNYRIPTVTALDGGAKLITYQWRNRKAERKYNNLVKALAKIKAPRKK